MSDCVTCGGSGMVARGPWNGDPEREPETVDCATCSPPLLACEQCGYRFTERPGRSGKWASLCFACLSDEAF
jgi:hypothetical protein